MGQAQVLVSDGSVSEVSVLLWDKSCFEVMWSITSGGWYECVLLMLLQWGFSSRAGCMLDVINLMHVIMTQL